MRRVLDFAATYPEARRVVLATNYRCPAAVVHASSRLIAVNRERFDKPIQPGPAAPIGPTISAVATDDHGWPDRLVEVASAEVGAGRACCFLARTRSELEPVRLALVRAGIRHRTTVPAPLGSPVVRGLVARLRAAAAPGHPFHALRRLRAERGWSRSDPASDLLGDEERAALDALLGWAVTIPTAGAFAELYDAAASRLEELQDPAAHVELTTVHGAKGREWPTVVVIGWEEDRFPNRRALVQALDPRRALEEERRLAYVAVTRATRRLILAFDPAWPSRFLSEMGFELA